jgi:hypothetical protein
MDKNLQKLKQYLFDKNLYFESKIDTDLSQIVFYKFDTEFSVYFKFDSNMIRMLINSDTDLKSYYSNDISEIVDEIDIYCKRQECQLRQTVEIFT